MVHSYSDSQGILSTIISLDPGAVNWYLAGIMTPSNAPSAERLQVQEGY